MTADALASTTSADGGDDRIVRKAFRRIVWLLFALHVAAFIDRGNVSFAALQMNRELGLNATMFGLVTTVFYAGYILCEIPSNLMLARFGARLWLARIMLTIGIAASATSMVIGPTSLYGVRVVVGIAEAGFFPGVLLYMTYWFPRSYRARATAIFMMAQPLTSAVGAAISGFILEMNGVLGIAGWRWLFLLEGLPAVILGVIVYLYLDNGPGRAKWLSEAEKTALEARLERDRALEGGGGRPRSLLRLLATRQVILLALADFGLVVSLNSNGVWTPLVIRGFAGSASFTSIGLLAAFSALLCFVAMPFWGASSDRRRERPWHVRIAVLFSACGWLMIGWLGGPVWQYLGILVSAVGSYCALPIFWTLPASAAMLPPDSRPTGIALINTIGICGAALAPVIVGRLKDLTGSFAWGFTFVAAMMLMTIICVTLLRFERGTAAAAAAGA